MFGLTRRNQDISTYNPWREMEEFEFPQVITFYNKSLRYITKHMCF